SKLTVVITFLLMAFGIFILVDISVIIWDDLILPTIHIFDLANFQSWLLIAMIIFFLAYFLFFFDVKLKGL
ncbi:MAG: hypothetical protein ACFFC3_10040, partial [Candidatus Odinarchaeota archaeon]